MAPDRVDPPPRISRADSPFGGRERGVVELTFPELKITESIGYTLGPQK